MTEVVHCKSRWNAGVAAADRTCARRYLDDIAGLTMAPIVVRDGQLARSVIRDWFPVLPAPCIYPQAVLGGRPRTFLFTGQPGRGQLRKIAGLYASGLEDLRQVASRSQEIRRTRLPSQSSSPRGWFRRARMPSFWASPLRCRGLWASRPASVLTRRRGAPGQPVAASASLRGDRGVRHQARNVIMRLTSTTTARRAMAPPDARYNPALGATMGKDARGKRMPDWWPANRATRPVSR
jgi:hypothetical protein